MPRKPIRPASVSTIAGVTAIVCGAPPRSTTTESGMPGEARTMSETSANVDTGVPSMETIVSPGSNPATWAGGAGSVGAQALEPDAGTHSDSAETVVVAVCTPIPLKTIVNSTIARTRFIVGPPSITITRL